MIRYQESNPEPGNYQIVARKNNNQVNHLKKKKVGGCSASAIAADYVSLAADLSKVAADIVAPGCGNRQRTDSASKTNHTFFKDLVPVQATVCFH